MVAAAARVNPPERQGSYELRCKAGAPDAAKRAPNAPSSERMAQAGNARIECIGSAPFTAVQNSEHNQAPAVEPILNDVSSIQNTDYELAIFRSPLNRASKLRVIGKKLNLVHQLVGYELGQEWMLLLKETCETVEVGERILRPLDFHRSCQDLNPGVSTSAQPLRLKWAGLQLPPYSSGDRVQRSCPHREPKVHSRPSPIRQSVARR